MNVFLKIVLRELFVDWKQNGGRGEKASDDADTRPSFYAPAEAGEESAETSSNEKDSHEDSVYAIGGLRQLLQRATLVADL